MSTGSDGDYTTVSFILESKNGFKSYTNCTKNTLEEILCKETKRQKDNMSMDYENAKKKYMKFTLLDYQKSKYEWVKNDLCIITTSQSLCRDIVTAPIKQIIEYFEQKQIYPPFIDELKKYNLM